MHQTHFQIDNLFWCQASPTVPSVLWLPQVQGKLLLDLRQHNDPPARGTYQLEAPCSPWSGRAQEGGGEYQGGQRDCGMEAWQVDDHRRQLRARGGEQRGRAQADPSGGLSAPRRNGGGAQGGVQLEQGGHDCCWFGEVRFSKGWISRFTMIKIYLFALKEVLFNSEQTKALVVRPRIVSHIR